MREEGFFNILLLPMPVAVQQRDIDPTVRVAFFERNVVALMKEVGIEDDGAV